MEYFVQKNSLLDLLSDSDVLRKSAPGYYESRLQAIADLRALDDGTLHRGNEFRRVASLVNVPMMEALKIIEPEFLTDKRKFYGWLARHPEYRTYQKSGGSRPTVTFTNGDQIAV